MTSVYYYDFSEDVISDFSLKNDLRNNYLLTISDLKRKKQSYFVWKLLERVLLDEKIDFSQGFANINGKWMLNNSFINFSFAHSNNIVCVAFSDGAVGVDIELFSEKILKLKKKIPLPNNLLSKKEQINYLLRKWTEQEALFKANCFCEKSKHCIIKDNNALRYMLTCVSNEQIKINKINNLI